jgi:hypothetical protein
MLRNSARSVAAVARRRLLILSLTMLALVCSLLWASNGTPAIAETVDLPTSATLQRLWPAPNGSYLATYADGSDTYIGQIDGDATPTNVIQLAAPVSDLTFGPDSVAYMAVDMKLLSLAPSGTTVGLVHEWKPEPDGTVRQPKAVNFVAENLFVEALAPNRSSSCKSVLYKISPAGEIVDSESSPTSCGGPWDAGAAGPSVLDLENGNVNYFDHATLERTTAPVPGTIFDHAAGADGSYAFQVGNQCTSMQIADVTPSGSRWQLSLADIFSTAAGQGCRFGDLTVATDGSVVLALIDADGRLHLARVDTKKVITDLGTSANQVGKVSLVADGSGRVVAAAEEIVDCSAAGNPTGKCVRVHIRSYGPDSASDTDTFGGSFGTSTMLSVDFALNDGSLIVPYMSGDYWCGISCVPDGFERGVRHIAVEVTRQSWHDPALGVAPPPSQTNNSPQWSLTTPATGTRFDLVPGKTAGFSLIARDPDMETVEIVKDYFTPAGQSRSKPDYVTCNAIESPIGEARLDCTVAPIANGLAVMRVNAVDRHGGGSGERSFLVGGSPYKYVALGDSYSAGEGVDPYFRDGYNEDNEQDGTVDNRCHRSSRAYAELVQPPGFTTPLYILASGNATPGVGKRINKYGSDANVRRSGDIAWAFLACSGAVTPNVLPALDGGTKPAYSSGYRELSPQLDYPAIDYGTDIVTITIGGNDVGFVDVIKYCATTNCDTPGYVTSLKEGIDQLKPQLLATYRAILEKTFNARVVVAGYPHLFPPSSDEQNCTKLRPWRGEQDMLRNMTDRLNSVITSAATEAGIQFEDVTDEFEHHEVCGALGEWINGPSGTWKPSDKFLTMKTSTQTYMGSRKDMRRR